MKPISLSVCLSVAGRVCFKGKKNIGLEISTKKFSNLRYRRIRFLHKSTILPSFFPDSCFSCVSDKILFHLGYQARALSWFNSKNFTRFSRIQDSGQNRQILPCQPRFGLHDSWMTGQDLSVLSRILLPSWTRIWKERWQDRRLV
jgi:hypothetical protein